MCLILSFVFWVLDISLSEPQAHLSTAHLSPLLSGHLPRWFHNCALLVLRTRASDCSLFQEMQVQLLKEVEGLSLTVYLFLFLLCFCFRNEVWGVSGI